MSAIHEAFKRLFPEFSLRTSRWYVINQSTIRIIGKGNKNYIFTYNNDDEWCLGTLKKYKGDKKDGEVTR